MNRLIFILFFLVSCTAGETLPLQKETSPLKISRLEELISYIKKNTSTPKRSKAIGTVSNGKLVKGTLFPFSGNNFEYFDTTSYLADRAFTHSSILKATLSTYVLLEKTYPNRKFFCMELSNKHGGKLSPHRTHQNGLSIDFMSPLKKAKKPYYELDRIGQAHYLLQFDNNGSYSGDKSIKIDFNLIAHHILLLDQEARKNGFRINKVIFKKELKDDLYESDWGRKLRSSSIYITRNLEPFINDLHDDHYHIDFEPIIKKPQ